MFFKTLEPQMTAANLIANEGDLICFAIDPAILPDDWADDLFLCAAVDGLQSGIALEDMETAQKEYYLNLTVDDSDPGKPTVTQGNVTCFVTLEAEDYCEYAEAVFDVPEGYTLTIK